MFWFPESLFSLLLMYSLCIPRMRMPCSKCCYKWSCTPCFGKKSERACFALLCLHACMRESRHALRLTNEADLVTREYGDGYYCTRVLVWLFSFQLFRAAWGQGPAICNQWSAAASSWAWAPPLGDDVAGHHPSSALFPRSLATTLQKIFPLPKKKHLSIFLSSGLLHQGIDSSLLLDSAKSLDSRAPDFCNRGWISPSTPVHQILPFSSDCCNKLDSLSNHL